MIQKRINNGEIILGHKGGKRPDKNWILSIGDAIDKKKKIKLDISSPHVIFVCGTRGSGKSYTLGVLAEEIAEKNLDIATVIVDPIGVFWSMKYSNQEKKEIKLLKKAGLEPHGIKDVNVFIPTGYQSEIPKETYDTDFSFRPNSLTTEDWCLTFGIDRYNPQGLLLERAMEKLKGGYTRRLGDKITGGSRDVPPNENFSLDDLLDCINHDREITSKEKGFNASTRRALTSRLMAAKDWGIFGKEKEISDIVKSGKIAVIDISFLQDNIGALVLGLLARKLLAARKAAARKEAVKDLKGLERSNSDSIPPTWLMVDEAHSFAPASGKTAATNPLIEYVKQGRRPGLSAVLSTQQPSALNSKIISQLDILISHRLAFENDIKEVHKRIPTTLPKNLKGSDTLKKLKEGTALTADKETSSAFISSIRPRFSQHEGRERIMKPTTEAPKQKKKNKSITEAQEDVEIEETSTTTMEPEEYIDESFDKRTVEITTVPFLVDLNTATKVAEDNMKRFLGIFQKNETMERISKFYYPIWSALIDYYPEDKESINLRAQIDGLTGEILKRGEEGLERTKGVRTFSQLKPSEINTLFEIVRNRPIDKNSISGSKKDIDTLIEKDLVEIRESEGKTFFDLKEEIYIPPELSKTEILAAEEIPEREDQEVPIDRKIDRVINEEIMIETLKAFGDIEIIEHELFYYPYWIAKLRNKGDTRILAIDGILGKRDKYAEKMLRRRVEI